MWNGGMVFDISESAFPVDEGVEEGLVGLHIELVVLEDLGQGLLVSLDLIGNGLLDLALFLQLLLQVLQSLLYTRIEGKL